MTVKAKFEVVSCQGDHVKFVELEGDEAEFDYDAGATVFDHDGRVLEEGGIRNYRCEGCYDSAYRVQFVGIERDTPRRTTMPIALDMPPLQNGATVLGSRATRDGWIVLADWNNQFVTWCVDLDGHAFWGRYHGSSYDVAYTDYNDRCVGVC